MMEKRVLPVKWYVLGGNLGRNVREVWWYACLTWERRLVLKVEAEPMEVERRGSWGGSEGSGGWSELLEVVWWTGAGVVWCQTVTAPGMRLWA